MDPELGAVALGRRERGLERREQRVRTEDPVRPAQARTSMGRSRNRAWAAPWPTRIA